MSERVMPKMFKFQEDIVRNTWSKTIIGNFSRGLGKNYTIACKILYERPKKVMFVDGSTRQFLLLSEKFDEILRENGHINNLIKSIIRRDDMIKINFINGDDVHIYNYLKISQVDTYDMVIYNDILPNEHIESNRYLCMVSMNYKDLRNSFDCYRVALYEAGIKVGLENNLIDENFIKEVKEDDNYFKNELDILNEYDSLFKYDNFYDEQIKELMIEYASTPKKENTTMTRDKILQQIKMLKDMKRDSK